MADFRNDGAARLQQLSLRSRVARVGAWICRAAFFLRRMHESSAIIGFIGRLPSQNFMNSDRSCPPVSGSPDIMTLRLRLAESFNVRWTINVVRSSAPLSSILVDPIILTIGLRRRDELGLNSGELFSETRDGGLQSMTNRTSHRLTIVTYPAYDFHIIATNLSNAFAGIAVLFWW